MAEEMKKDPAVRLKDLYQGKTMSLMIKKRKVTLTVQNKENKFFTLNVAVDGCECSIYQTGWTDLSSGKLSNTWVDKGDCIEGSLLEILGSKYVSDQQCKKLKYLV